MTLLASFFSVLRKKVDTLLSDNLKLTREVKDANTALSEEKRKKVTTSRWSQPAPDKGNAYFEGKIDELQGELSATRVKLIEKDREVEQLETKIRQLGPAKGSSLKRGKSQDEDLLMKMEVIEKEAK